MAVHRYKFNSRVRQQGESVASFVAELRHLAIDCEFGDSLNEMLRDRLVCGVNDSRIQRRLLSEADLDFDKALKAALAMEMADRDAEDLQGDKKATTTEGAIFRAGVGEPRNRGYQNCYRCGGKHKASLCKHKENVCHHCGKKGHILRACRKARSETRSPPQTPRNTMPVTIEGEEKDVYTMFPLCSKKYGPIYITIIVNGAPLLMQVDTGATLSVISKATYDRAWREESPPLAPSTARLRTYTGEEIPVKGEIEVDVCHRDQQKRLTLIVTEGNGPSLLGRNWLNELRLNWKTTYQQQCWMITRRSSGRNWEPLPVRRQRFM